MVPERELICAIPYLGKTSLDLRTRLRRTIKGSLPYFKLKVFYGISAKHIFILFHIISDHLLQCNCTINLDDFDILAADSYNIKLLLRESLLIKRDKPMLNSALKLFPLEVFD